MLPGLDGGARPGQACRQVDLHAVRLGTAVAARTAPAARRVPRADARQCRRRRGDLGRFGGSAEGRSLDLPAGRRTYRRRGRVCDEAGDALGNARRGDRGQRPAVRGRVAGAPAGRGARARAPACRFGGRGGARRAVLRLPGGGGRAAGGTGRVARGPGPPVACLRGRSVQATRLPVARGCRGRTAGAGGRPRRRGRPSEACSPA